VDDRGGGSVLQYPTHTDLIASDCYTASPRGDGLDAIIVPASRPAGNLRAAVDLAAETGARLVVLCSFRAKADDVQALTTGRRLRDLIVVEVPQDRDDWILRDFATTHWVHRGPGKGVCGARNSDLSVKRNTGLLLARMLGWKRIFFMDDDIREVSADAVLSTVSLLGAHGRGYRTAGMSIKEYPDNSVVCHARRAVGEFQDVFVSGSVLAVDCTAPFEFFPDIYNEDWLFFYRDALDERLATSGSPARQLKYDPFADPQRAAGQEFGDVIAEGLYTLLHGRLRVETAGEDYWNRFLASRNKVLDDVSGRLPKLAPESRGEVSKAISAAQQVLWTITAKMCADYVAAWRQDVVRWGDLSSSLPELSSTEKALEILGFR
jgi:hypothetical protein